uniref:Uncharacterized protein n=1 Tax=Octopus bimaculoides TaxID=37653 RepID=A0A0L8FJS0_OCTBM
MGFFYRPLLPKRDINFICSAFLFDMREAAILSFIYCKKYFSFVFKVVLIDNTLYACL